MQKHENDRQHENKHETFLLLILWGGAKAPRPLVITALIDDDDCGMFF